MKHLLLLLIGLSAALAADAQKPVNPNASPEAVSLLQSIYAQSGKGTLTGQHSYPLYADVMIERVENLTGYYPVVFGQDFGYSKAGSLDGINFRQRTVDKAIEWHRRGGIVTLMWHAVPPTTDANFTTWQGPNGVQSRLTDEQWQQLITDGTEINLRWKSQVDVIAFYLKQLQDAGVPVIWRPYHEMNGDWFWWCGREGDRGYRSLYRMLYQRLTYFHKLNNLIWVFNANELGSSNVKGYDGFYPGHEYVDVLATDIYNHNYNRRDYDELLRLGEGKPIAWGECGKLPTPQVVREQPKWVWFMCWSEWLETANDYQQRTDIYNATETITLEEYNASKK